MVVAPRSPSPAFTGDRVRTQLWIEALTDRAEVVLVTSPGERPSFFPPTITAAPSLRNVRALPRIAAGRLPLHTLAVARYDWRSAIRSAGAFDCAVVILTRTDPWVFDALGAPHRLLDAIDSATAGMRQRASAAGTPLTRAFWSAEARKSECLERDAGRRYDRVLLVSAEEESAFGERATTVPMGVDVMPAFEGERRFDFGFWGRLAYFANDEAARTLVKEIWPVIRRLRPRSTLFIGGEGAAPWLRAMHGEEGITVSSPAGDRAAALRQIRVALLPIGFGTGQSMKTIEAAEAGCAIVGSPLAFRSMPDLASAGIVSESASFAETAVSLLEEGQRWREVGGALRNAVISGHSRQRSRERLAALALEGV